MPERVLPALRVLAIVREAVHDEAVDVGQRQHALGRRQDGHGRQGDVRVRRLLVAVALARRARHSRFDGLDVGRFSVLRWWATHSPVGPQHSDGSADFKRQIRNNAHTDETGSEGDERKKKTTHWSGAVLREAGDCGATLDTTDGAMTQADDGRGFL